MDRSRQYYFLAILLAILFHGTLLVFTVGNTYDAYVHMFFADHYSESWFETWNYKWYAGFTMTSYPPLVHQIIALLSKLIGLKAGFICWAVIVYILLVRGVYHFSLLWVNRMAASYAALLAVLSTSITEALHVFGQLPSLTGMALLLNACPQLYWWLRTGNKWRLFAGISLLACITSAHHVTTIFGMVFFVLPVLGTAVLDNVSDQVGGLDKLRFKAFLLGVWRKLLPLILLGIISIVIVVTAIFPYWYWSLTDPISQVSIPHGSRASFIEKPNLGLVFFLIPWGVMLLFIPAIFAKIFKKRSIFLALSFALLFILGTGGTTPIPKLILGTNAFEILTLDRFTFWASIMAIPFFAQLFYSLVEGNLGESIKSRIKQGGHRLIIIGLISSLVLCVFLVVNFGNIRPTQPKAIETKPIANFLERDGHDRWRYLTLGFGDQMAWLSANTNALTIDGNYHSARRLPEMTSRAVERLENAKYLGVQGIGSLQQFLSFPEKYNLKYIFSNDKFYEPVLHFMGWSKLAPLENNIDVWERKDVVPLPAILPKKEIPRWHAWLWGTLPLSFLCLAILFNLRFFRQTRQLALVPLVSKNKRYRKLSYLFYLMWSLAVFTLFALFMRTTLDKKNNHKTPEELVLSYFHQLDFKYFEEAYHLLDPATKPDMDQYRLELSLEDGILASYAKLDAIEWLDKKQITDQRIEAKIRSHWLTSIKSYHQDHAMVLVEKKGLWYVEYAASENNIPPDQFIRMPSIDFYNQGRRVANTDKTRQEDILDRPEIYIREANLVKLDGRYHVVGEIINMDNDPAFITIEASLYDAEDNEVIHFPVKDIVTRNLLPKESSYFRIDFEDVLSRSISKKLPDSYDPDFTNLFSFDREITNFNVFVRSVVSSDPVYKYYGLSDALVSGGSLMGSFVNYGNQEISIPQLVIAQEKDNALQWVEAHYLEKGIRPQRFKDFSLRLDDVEGLSLIKKGNDRQLLVNGVSRRAMLKSINPQIRSLRSSNIGQKLKRNQRSYAFQVNGLISYK